MMQEQLAAILPLSGENLLDNEVNTDKNRDERQREQDSPADTWNPWMQL